MSDFHHHHCRRHPAVLPTASPSPPPSSPQTYTLGCPETRACTDDTFKSNKCACGWVGGWVSGWVCELLPQRLPMRACQDGDAQLLRVFVQEPFNIHTHRARALVENGKLRPVVKQLFCCCFVSQCIKRSAATTIGRAPLPWQLSASLLHSAHPPNRTRHQARRLGRQDICHKNK